MRSARTHRTAASGFTVVELLLVATIVGVLAAIALPSYRQHVLRTQRAVAAQALAQLAARQQSFYADRKRYGRTLTELGYEVDAMSLLADGTLSATSGRAIYELRIADDASDLNYTLVARPINRQIADRRCGTLSIDQNGVRSASGHDGPACWTR